MKSERAHGVVMEKLCSHIGSFPERKEYPLAEKYQGKNKSMFYSVD